jgi:hypothetical protein
VVYRSSRDPLKHRNYNRKIRYQERKRMKVTSWNLDKNDDVQKKQHWRTITVTRQQTQLGKTHGEKKRLGIFRKNDIYNSEERIIKNPMKNYRKGLAPKGSTQRIGDMETKNGQISLKQRIIIGHIISGEFTREGGHPKE